MSGSSRHRERWVDVEIPWLQRVPAHWSIRRGKVLTVPVRRDPRATDGVVTAFRDGQVTLRSNRRLDGFTEAVQEIGYQGVRAGELVIHSMDGFAGAIGVSDADGKMSPVVHIYDTIDAEPRYLAYVLRTVARSGFITSLARGIRERSTSFDRNTFRDLALPAPPLEEQRRIADFLDAETAQIDALTAEQEHFIALLRERRTELLASSFIGDHPTRPLGTCLDALIDHRGKTPGKMGGSDFSDSGIRVVSAIHIKDGQVSWSERERFVPEWMFEKWMTVRTRKDDVLLTSEAPLGNVAQVPDDDPLVVSQRLYCLRGKRGVLNSTYLRHFLESEPGQELLKDGLTGSIVTGIRQSKLVKIPVPVPPLPEQARVVGKLVADMAKIDTLRAEAEHNIALSKERRAALITAAVTGQIDVTTGRAA